MQKPIPVIIAAIVFILRGGQAIYFHSIDRFPAAWGGHLDVVGWVQIVFGVCLLARVKASRWVAVGLFSLLALVVGGILVRVCRSSDGNMDIVGIAVNMFELVVYVWLAQEFASGSSVKRYLGVENSSSTVKERSQHNEPVT